MINTREDLKLLYQEDHIIEPYIDERFSKPLGRVQHCCQVDCVNRIIEEYNVKNVLEIACGPARLTAEIKGFVKGFALDSSDTMLEVAKSRTSKKLAWQFVKGDAFQLNFKNKFDLVYSFRFIRHLKLEDRDKVYNQVKNVLVSKGLLIFDAIRYEKPLFLRKHESGGKILVYDKVYKNKAKLQAELKAAGFELVKLYPCIEHFYIQAFFSRISHILKNDLLGIRIIQFLEKIKTGHPLEWIVLCQKK
jgi:ubiquinone/menaquinone biosynthesis C-methylase UbiE